MGWKLATAAYEAALGDVLTPRARIALDHLCRSALDAPKGNMPAAEYWGGSVALAKCLLGPTAGGKDSDRKAAQRALNELIDKGLIEQTHKAAPGQTARYRILIEGWERVEEHPTLPVDNYEELGVVVPFNGLERGTPMSPERGTPVSRTWDTSVPNVGHQCPPDRGRRVRG